MGDRDARCDRIPADEPRVFRLPAGSSLARRHAALVDERAVPRGGGGREALGQVRESVLRASHRGSADGGPRGRPDPQPR